MIEWTQVWSLEWKVSRPDSRTPAPSPLGGRVDAPQTFTRPPIAVRPVCAAKKGGLLAWMEMEHGFGLG